MSYNYRIVVLLSSTSKQRGLGRDTIAYWRLGYAPEDWQHLEKSLPQDIEGLKLLD